MDAPRKAMQGMLSKQWLLRCHILLGLRWCFVPLTVLLLSGSVLVACQLGGHYAAWSLALLLAYGSAVGSTKASVASILLTLALTLSAAALFCLPMMGREALAAMIIYLVVMISGGMACRSQKATSQGFAAKLQRLLFAAWAAGEAVLGIAVSAGLLYAASTLLADEKGPIERQWVFFWRLLCINCAASVLSFVMLPLLLLRIFREPKDAYRPQMELQVIGACSGELEPIEVKRLSRNLEPSRCARRLFIGSAAACVACMVLSTTVFLFFHVMAPGQSLESLAKAQVCDSCFCGNVSLDVGMVYDLKYGSAYSERHGEEVDLLLDVYRPTAARGSKAPAVLLIHGGNFIGGSKQAGIMEAEALYFARAGFVVFNMNYRLEGSTYLVELSAVRDAVHDAKAAVRFIVDQAESFGVDPTRIAAWGESAGGITAISMNSVSSEGSSGNPGLSSNISAAVSLSGTMWPFLVASPRNKVLRDTPWFNVHSKADNVVYPFLAVMTHVYLLAKGVPDPENRLVWVSGAEHVPWSSSVRATVRPMVLNFLLDVMNLKVLCQV